MIVDKYGNEVKEAPKMPEWHGDIVPNAIILWCGHEFEFLGIDPEHDVNVVVIKYRGPTKATKRRKDAARN